MDILRRQKEKGDEMVNSLQRHNETGSKRSQDKRLDLLSTKAGFTFIELLIVIVLLSIASMMAIPMMSSAGSVQIRSAVNMIAADLEYAKSVAISSGQVYSVVFDASANSYQIKDQNDVTIEHPVKKGFDYAVSFQSDSRLNKVDIVSVDFDPDSTGTVKFDYLGSPYNGNDDALNSGVISLQADGVSMSVNVEPVTGYISITN